MDNKCCHRTCERVVSKNGRALLRRFNFRLIFLMLWPCSSLRGSICLVLAVLLGRLTTVVHGDFGDYADLTFNCPALTTCKQVCVANASLCPFEMVCSEGEMLCADGTCAAFCSGNEISPCESTCTPFACPKVIDFHDQCQEKYGPAFDAAKTCAKAEATDSASLYSFKEPGFIFFTRGLSLRPYSSLPGPPLTSACLPWKGPPSPLI